MPFFRRAAIRECLAPYLVPFRGHSRRTWLLWAIGTIVLVSVAELQPGVLVYVYDPELLAGVVAFTSWLVARRTVAVAGWVATVVRRVGCAVAPRYVTATDRVAIRVPSRALTTWLFVLPL